MRQIHSRLVGDGLQNAGRCFELLSHFAERRAVIRDVDVGFFGREILDRAAQHRDFAFKPLERGGRGIHRSEEHTSELQSLMRISYAVFCLKKKKEATPALETQKDSKHITQQKQRRAYK